MIDAGAHRFVTRDPVLVLAPGYHGHGIARSLGRLGVPVYGVHADRRSPAARSKYWRGNYFWDLAQARPDVSVGWLLMLATKIGGRPILVPTDDDSCLFVADNASALQEGFRFPDQPDGLARDLVSKRTMYELCKQHAIPTAETRFPQSREDVVAYARDGVFPVMLKGIDTKALRRRTGFTMVVCRNPDELLEWYDKLEPPGSPSLMLQEYIPGGPEQVWMFDGYFNRGSECLFGITGKKLRQFPAYTGVTSLGICLANDVVESQTRAFMKAIGYRGVLDLGYKYDARSGQYKLLDVNPRVGSTFRLFVDSIGMDVVRALYRDLTGQPVPIGASIEGRRWVVENFDIPSSYRYWRDRRLRIIDWLRSYRGVQEGSWFARDDVAPMLAMLRRSIAVAMNGSFARGARATAQTKSAQVVPSAQ